MGRRSRWVSGMCWKNRSSYCHYYVKSWTITRHYNVLQQWKCWSLSGDQMHRTGAFFMKERKVWTCKLPFLTILTQPPTLPLQTKLRTWFAQETRKNKSLKNRHSFVQSCVHIHKRAQRETIRLFSFLQCVRAPLSYRRRIVNWIIHEFSAGKCLLRPSSKTIVVESSH